MKLTGSLSPLLVTISHLFVIKKNVEGEKEIFKINIKLCN